MIPQHPIMRDDIFKGACFLMRLAEMRDEEFKQNCQSDYNKTSKPDEYPSWEAYYRALSAPTESGGQSSNS